MISFMIFSQSSDHVKLTLNLRFVLMKQIRRDPTKILLQTHRLSRKIASQNKNLAFIPSKEVLLPFQRSLEKPVVTKSALLKKK